MRELEDTRASVVGTGERAFLMTEDFALEQRLGNRRAVHRDERERGTRAQLVDRLGDQLLAGPRLSPDEHGCRRRRRLFDHAIDRADPGTVPDDPAEAALLAQLAAKLTHLTQRVLPLDRLLQQDAQALRVDGLAQVVVGAVLDRLDGAFDGALRRQQDEGDVGELVLQRAEQIVAAHPRHHEVAHDDRRTKARDLAERVLAVTRLVGLVTPGLHELGEADPRGRIVLDDQHALARSGRGAESRAG